MQNSVIIGSVNENSPFNIHNGIQISEAENGMAKCVVKVEKDHLNLWDTVHGGMYYSMLDVTCGAAACTCVEKGVVTTTSSINFLRSAKAGDTLTCIGKVDKAGKSVVFVSGEIRDQDNNLLTTYSCTMSVIK